MRVWVGGEGGREEMREEIRVGGMGEGERQGELGLKKSKNQRFF
jgi:hypothetical protein